MMSTPTHPNHMQRPPAALAYYFIFLYTQNSDPMGRLNQAITKQQIRATLASSTTATLLHALELGLLHRVLTQQLALKVQSITCLNISEVALAKRKCAANTSITSDSQRT